MGDRNRRGNGLQLLQKTTGRWSDQMGSDQRFATYAELAPLLSDLMQAGIGPVLSRQPGQ